MLIPGFMSTPTNITTFVIDDRDPRIRYIGTDWGTLGNAEVECNGTTHLTWTKGSSFSFSYNGNAMRSSVTPLSGEMHMAADTYVLPLQALASVCTALYDPIHAVFLPSAAC